MSPHFGTCTRRIGQIMKVGEIVNLIQGYAPLELQSEYDNSGLQIGFPDAEVTGVLLCVDVTPAVVSEAASKGANVVISHHPVFFKPLSCVVAGTFRGDIVLKAAERRISIISAHTNMDCALGGLNDFLAAALGIDVDVSKAGEGEFYRIGVLRGGLTLGQFADKVETVIGAKADVIGNRDKIVSVAAVSTGAGGGDEDMFDKCEKAGVDVIVTSEVKHHIAVRCAYEGKGVIELKHYDSEKCARNIMAGLLASRGIDCLFADESSPYNR